MDLIAFTLTLQAHPDERAEDAWPRWWGRAAHALVLDVIRSQDEALAEAIHAGEGLRPFTVSTLMGRFSGGRPQPDTPYRLRLTGLSERVSGALHEAASSGSLAVGRTLELDYCPFEVEAVALEEEAWSGRASYTDLAAGALAGEVPRRLSLRFTSPTTFKSGGRHMPIPLPDLTFGSLLAKWNAFAPLAFPEEARRYAAECLVISRYHLESRSARMKGGGMRVGAVGRVTYATVNYDRYWMGVMLALARFALFGGVGAGAAMGLGQTRQVVEDV